VTRFYRALLRLYPGSFRREYEGELSAAFVQRVHGRSAAYTFLAALGDVVPNAVAMHVEILGRDLRFAARAVMRAPGFAITTILVVALGVGANTAAFSLADFVFLRPLPFHEPDRLVKLWQRTPDYGQMELSPGNYRDWKAASRSFSGFAVYSFQAANLVGGSEPRRLDVVKATPDLHQVLGVPALIGRPLAPADSEGVPVVVLSYALWQTQFGGDPGVIGRAVRLDGTPHTIVGVMPATFNFPQSGTDAWTPLVFREENYEDRTDTYITGIARLRDGVSTVQARNEMIGIAAQLAKAYPAELEDVSAWVLGLRDEVSSSARMLVLALCGAALCILLLACANLASLFLVRATSRVRELAVRTALGAGREQIIRQLVTESVTLSVFGGVVGIAVAWATVPLLARLVPQSLPLAASPTIDARVLAFAFALMIVTGLVFGVGPAIGAGKSNGLELLRAGTRTTGGRTRRVRAALVVIEISASVVLLILSGLLIRSVWNIQARDPGFHTQHLLTLRTALPPAKYDSVARREQYYERVLARVRALPGVERAAFITGLPMVMRGGIWGAGLNGVEPPRTGSHSVSLRFVTTGYFSAMDIPLRRGRDVENSDTQKSLFIAVVSESFAKRHWPDEDPIGKRFSVAFSERTVAGVVADVRVRGLEQESEPQVYIPYRQVEDGSLVGYLPKDLVVRSELPASALLPSLRAIVKEADPEQPVSHVRTIAQILEGETASRLTQLRLLMTLAIVGLLIAGVGIHGLLSFTVSRRIPELGVRRALGAQVGGIVRHVLGEGLRLAVAGVVVGVGLAYVAARGMGALLSEVKPEDPATIGVSAALCFATAILGCVRPAIRAARVDPIQALRSD